MSDDCCLCWPQRTVEFVGTPLLDPTKLFRKLVAARAVSTVNDKALRSGSRADRKTFGVYTGHILRVLPLGRGFDAQAWFEAGNTQSWLAFARDANHAKLLLGLPREPHRVFPRENSYHTEQWILIRFWPSCH